MVRTMQTARKSKSTSGRTTLQILAQQAAMKCLLYTHPKTRTPKWVVLKRNKTKQSVGAK
jgi:hypothetical protein